MGVVGAFDAYFSDPDDVRQLPGASVELVARAERLRDTIIDVVGTPSDAKFSLVVGDGGAESARLRCRPQMNGTNVSIDTGFEHNPGDPQTASEIRDAMGSGELVNVYYSSGHVISQNSIAFTRLEHARFKSWEFHDFTGFDVCREKPGALDQAGRDLAIGEDGDDSLFAWVVQTLKVGHLTCDDGPNEIADFVHLDPSGTLSLLHVKAAGKAAHRRPAAGAYELVSAQAAKSLRFVRTTSELVRGLGRNPGSPTWHDGVRVPDRSEMMKALASRPVSADAQVVILQPHLSKSSYDAAVGGSGGGSTSIDLRRVELIETLLNAVRGDAVGLGADLFVWTSL